MLLLLLLRGSLLPINMRVGTDGSTVPVVVLVRIGINTSVWLLLLLGLRPNGRPSSSSSEISWAASALRSFVSPCTV